MQILFWTVLVIATSFSELIGARPGDDLPQWAKWIQQFREPRQRGRLRGNPGWGSEDDNGGPDNRGQQFGNQWQQPFNLFNNQFGQNQFGQFGQNPFGGNPFGEIQRPGQFGGNQFQRPGQFGQNQRPDQFGENQFGQNQRPNQNGGDQNNQNQRPDQFGENQFGQNQRPNQNGGDQYGQNQRPDQNGGDQFGQNQRPDQNGEDQFSQNQRPEQSGEEKFGQNQNPTERPTQRPTERPNGQENGESSQGSGPLTSRPLQPGESCTRNNKVGKCIRIHDCAEVLQGIQQNRPPPRPCYVAPESPVPFVCCLDLPGAPKPTPRPTTTSRPVTPRPAKVGESVAKRKCREYAKLVLETVESPVLVVTSAITVDKCVKSAEGLIVGGKEATLGEFPHMALLGYGDNPDALSYECGGSLISEKYVLTAAHCIADSTPTYVLLGDLILRNDNDQAHPQLIPIASDRGVIPHPEYRYPAHYYDVALVRLAKEPTLGPMVRPACLHTGDPYPPGSLIASGWGRTDFGGDASDILMKVNLNNIEFDQCNKTYRNLGNKLANGIRNDQQICAGHLEGGKDTCQGDSGGPLQVFRSNPHCTYDIVGVVSFGKGCALRNTPGVYARVRYYVDWIESVVWPGLSSRASEPDSGEIRFQ